MNTNPLHLYRSLLRECTYLPDGKLQAWTSDYVTARFRKYIPKHNDPQPAKPELAFKRKIKVLHDARKLLSMLCRANDGCSKPLEKVFRLAYGRIGPRRYELLAPVTLRESSQDGPKDRHSPPKNYASGWEPSAIFQSLMRSQVTRDARLQQNTKLQPIFKFPSTNIWGRPMAESRIRNAKRKWYAKNLQQIMPPLEDKDWLDLKRRTHTDDWDIVQRRPRPGSEDNASDDVGVWRTSQKSTGVLTGPIKSSIRSEKQDRPHVLTPRYISRLVSRIILKQSPMTTTDKEGTHHFRWDDGSTRSHKPQEIDAMQAAALFGSHDE